MSQDAGREKVFQTTKVRTSIRSDLSWIQKMKDAENIRDSGDRPEERTHTLSRQLSYVLMTAKKFEPDTSPEKELQIGKHSEPVSSEPTAANDVDLKSNDSAEVSRVDVKENCEEAKFETVIVNDPTAVEGSVANKVPDIIAESVSKSSPEENGNDLSTENAFDNLYNSLVEPIDPIHLDSKKAVEAQTTPDISAVIDEPQDDTATDTNQSTKECGTVNGNVHVQNDEEAMKSEEKENEQPKEQDVSTTFTERPEDSLETTETQSTKLDIVECETTNGEVTEQKQSGLNDVPSDAPLADSQPQSKDLPSINGDTSMIVDDTDAQDNVNPSHTEEALSETKEAIVDEISTGQESKSVEVVVVAHPTSTEEESTIKAGVVVSETDTAVVDPDKSNEADPMLEKEMVDAKSEAESVVSEIVETKSQTETNNGTMIGKHSEPVSSEPTAANDVDLKSNDSAEVSRVDVKENCEEAKFETVIVNDPTAVEGSVANKVPDIITESVSKSSPEENGNDLSTENAFDNLYNSLVEPIDPIHLDSKKAVEAQTAPDISAVIDEPQDDTATDTNQSTKECGTVNGNVHVQNDEEAIKSEEKENEQPKEQDVSTTFTETPEDSLETTETQSTKLDIVECETTNGEVTEQKQSGLNDVPSDAPLADSQPQSKDLPSINGDTSMIVDDTDAQDNVNPSPTEEALSETKEAIVDEISTGQESKSVEVVVVAHPTSTEEESTIKAEVVVSETATAVVDPDKSNEADPMLEKEMVDDISAVESVVSERVETKSQTETNNGTMMESVDVTPKENVVSLNKVDVQTPIETPEVIQESVEIAVQSAMVNVNPEEIFKAVPVVVVPSTWEAEESGPLEKEVAEENISEEATEIESIPLVPSVAGENQAVFDLSNALEIVPTSESKEEVGKMETTDAFDEAPAVKTVKESEEPADNNGSPSSMETEETSPKSFIMRDGREVCSHCDQFIGLVNLIIEYPPMYLHPECLTCGTCTQNLGNLLIPMFEHNHLIYCSDCYDVVYRL